jgi:hypothetical protein
MGFDRRDVVARHARLSGAVVSGGVGGTLATVIVAVYLGAIEIDDGLEALVYLPLIGVISLAAAVPAGWRRASPCWPMVAASALVGTTAGLASLIPPARYAREIALLVLAGGSVFTIPCSHLGYVGGRIARRKYQAFERGCSHTRSHAASRWTRSTPFE